MIEDKEESEIIGCPKCGSLCLLIWMGEQYGYGKLPKYSCIICKHKFNIKE